MIFLPYISFGITAVIYIALALIPAIFLMRYIYRIDSADKEPRNLLVKLALSGVAAALVSILLESAGSALLNVAEISPESPVYHIITAFLIVAVAEEGTKFFFMKRASWKHPAFNYRFDGIVYSVFTSLGFAGFENIIYVFSYGPSAIVSRALLSIPGHMNFAIIMGLFYGRAKVCEKYGDHEGKKKNLIRGFVFAVLLHGFYDACLMIGTALTMCLFFIFVIIFYIYVYKLLKRQAATDEPI